MSEHTEEYAGAAAGAVNSSGPAERADQAAAAPAGPAPCGCGEKLEQLGGQVDALNRVARAAAYLAMVCAAGIMYLLWFGQGGDKGA